MTAKDKEYIDRQTNQLRSDINQLSERIVILEGRPVESAGSDIIKVEVDITQIRSIIEECFTQAIKNFENKQSDLFSYYDDMAKKLNENIALTNERYKLIHTGLVLIHKKFLTSKHTQEPQQSPLSTSHTTEKPLRFFANLPSGIHLAIRELCHRFTTRTHSWLTGNFTLPRSHTILSMLLYIALILLLTAHRLSITIS